MPGHFRCPIDLDFKSFDPNTIRSRIADTHPASRAAAGRLLPNTKRSEAWVFANSETPHAAWRPSLGKFSGGGEAIWDGTALRRRARRAIDPAANPARGWSATQRAAVHRRHRRSRRRSRRPRCVVLASLWPPEPVTPQTAHWQASDTNARGFCRSPDRS